jgi:hypothetical protein
VPGLLGGFCWKGLCNQQGVTLVKRSGVDSFLRGRPGAGGWQEMRMRFAHLQLLPTAGRNGAHGVFPGLKAEGLERVDARLKPGSFTAALRFRFGPFRGIENSWIRQGGRFALAPFCQNRAGMGHTVGGLLKSSCCGEHDDIARGLKPIDFARFMARLKSCPDTKPGTMAGACAGPGVTRGRSLGWGLASALLRLPSCLCVWRSLLPGRDLFCLRRNNARQGGQSRCR